MKTIRVGIIGVGHIAEIAHIPSLTELEDVEITAICDVDKKRLRLIENRYNVLSTYTNYNAMLENEELDCVFCLTRITEHADITIDCLNNGVHVFCEKPLASNLRDARKMVKASEKSGRWIMTGYNRRFAPAYKKAKDLFHNREINFFNAEKCYIKSLPSEYTTINNLIHIVDISNWFCGEPRTVSAEASLSNNKEPQTISAFIRYEGGAIATITEDHSGGSWIEKIEVYGDRYTAFVRAPTLTTTFCDGREERYDLGGTYYYPFHKLLGFIQEDQHFIESIRNDCEPSPSGKEGLRTLKLINEIHKKAGLPTLE